MLQATYEFDVFPVQNCPVNKEGWNSASTRLKCNSTHGYHCVPNKDLTSLIEFCYPRGYRFPFEAGIKISILFRVFQYHIIYQILKISKMFHQLTPLAIDECLFEHIFIVQNYNWDRALVQKRSVNIKA